MVSKRQRAKLWTPMNAKNMDFTVQNSQFITHFQRDPIPEVLEVVTISFDPTIDEVRHEERIIESVDHELAFAIGHSKRLIGKKLVWHVWDYPTRTEANSHAHLLRGRYKLELLTNAGGKFDNFNMLWGDFWNRRNSRF